MQVSHVHIKGQEGKQREHSGRKYWSVKGGSRVVLRRVCTHVCESLGGGLFIYDYIFPEKV